MSCGVLASELHSQPETTNIQPCKAVNREEMSKETEQNFYG